MTDYVLGTVGAGRSLTFEDKVIYSGESNSSVLKIPADFAGEDADYYTLSFEVSPYDPGTISNKIKDVTSTPAYLSGGYIYCPLDYEKTKSGSLRVQATAHKTEGDREITVKTGIGELTFEPSVDGHYLNSPETKGIYAELELFAKALSTLKSELESPDYDYISAALAARLLFVSASATPVYFPSTAGEAEETLGGIIDTYVADGTVTHYIVCPAEGSRRASLIAVYTSEGNAAVGRFAGPSLLGVLVKGAEE